MTNANLCMQVFQFLLKCQVDTVIICAGARNAPFVFQLESSKLNKFYFFEERSAAFFALGLMKQQNRPVAIITTSGTAAAEILPAAIEGFYQGLPLIIITADRPKSYRHSGAPQTICQVGLFSNYVEQTLDWDVHEVEFNIKSGLRKPIHLNICFDEPLLDVAIGSAQKINFVKTDNIEYPKASRADFDKIKKPLIIVGQLEQNQKTEVIEFIASLQAPVYLESLSQLKNEKLIGEFVIKASDSLVKKLFEEHYFTSVIRIGGVPTLRFWRDLEEQFKNIPVANFTNLPFSGLSRESSNFSLNFSNLNLEISKSGYFKNDKLAIIKAKDENLEDAKLGLLKDFSNSEPAFVNYLSILTDGAPIYLGNSNPIREWDLFAIKSFKKAQLIYANRGANGIDGQVSTYLGWSNAQAISWCLIGDLTALYDLASLGLSSQLAAESKKRLVVMNNKGGHIFKRIFKNELFLNSHEVEFEMWAKMWKWDYLKVTTEAELLKAGLNTSDKLIIEILPDNNQTTSFWNSWDAVCSKI
ncbi:MAG: 2-succinyl-5-enolpyruvyl-6-hydroxy-3-cyclohexene-1-carboxylic-acid synthase [Pseudobdellovibrio sp.]